jgi:hypothetical protein
MKEEKRRIELRRQLPRHTEHSVQLLTLCEAHTSALRWLASSPTRYGANRVAVVDHVDPCTSIEAQCLTWRENEQGDVGKSWDAPCTCGDASLPPPPPLSSSSLQQLQLLSFRRAVQPPHGLFCGFFVLPSFLGASPPLLVGCVVRKEREGEGGHDVSDG